MLVKSKELPDQFLFAYLLIYFFSFQTCIVFKASTFLRLRYVMFTARKCKYLFSALETMPHCSASIKQPQRPWGPYQAHGRIAWMDLTHPRHQLVPIKIQILDLYFKSLKLYR